MKKSQYGANSNLFLFSLSETVYNPLRSKVQTAGFVWLTMFRIPASPADLLASDDEVTLTVVQNTAIAELKAEEIQEFADGISIRHRVFCRCMCQPAYGKHSPVAVQALYMILPTTTPSASQNKKLSMVFTA